MLSDHIFAKFWPGYSLMTREREAQRVGDEEKRGWMVLDSASGLCGLGLTDAGGLA